MCKNDPVDARQIIINMNDRYHLNLSASEMADMIDQVQNVEEE